MPMTTDPGFDPYAVLGVGVDADELVIQLAYRARIREVHPDRAGATGLERAKQLNVARDWLLDPQRRARLPRTPAPGGSDRGRGEPGAPRSARRSRPRPARRAAQPTADAAAFDVGPHADELRAHLASIGSLGPDERARVNYSLGDGRALDFEVYREYIDPGLWRRSIALREAVARAWAMGVDEEAPLVPRLGRLLPHGLWVANAYAQWLLLADYFEHELGVGVLRGQHAIEAFTTRCTGPWLASVGQPRYGPFDEHIRAFLASAASLSVPAAAQLARSWRDQLDSTGKARPGDRVGPGVWLPAPANVPEVLRVSGYLAAVDASRIEPPGGLRQGDQDGFRHGLRLTAHVLAMGPVDGSTRAYLQPWLDAVGPDRSLWGRTG